MYPRFLKVFSRTQRQKSACLNLSKWLTCVLGTQRSDIGEMSENELLLGFLCSSVAFEIPRKDFKAASVSDEEGRLFWSKRTFSTFRSFSFASLWYYICKDAKGCCFFCHTVALLFRLICESTFAFTRFSCRCCRCPHTKIPPKIHWDFSHQTSKVEMLWQR